jgi:hypothetical protein
MKKYYRFVQYKRMCGNHKTRTVIVEKMLLTQPASKVMLYARHQGHPGPVGPVCRHNRQARFRSAPYADGLNDNRFYRMVAQAGVVGMGCGGCNGIDHIHTTGNTAERGVFTVEVVTLGMHDEKLRTRPVRLVAHAGHREHARCMNGIVKFVGDGGDGAALPVVELVAVTAVRVAGLDHKPGNNAVELGIVVKTALGPRDEVKTVDGGLVGEKLQGDLPFVGHDSGGNAAQVAGEEVEFFFFCFHSFNFDSEVGYLGTQNPVLFGEAFQFIPVAGDEQQAGEQKQSGLHD